MPVSQPIAPAGIANLGNQTTPEPQWADRCPARSGAPGYQAPTVTVHGAATRPGPLPARTAKVWNLMRLERQLCPEASSRCTPRRGRGARLAGDGLPVREHFAEPPGADVKNEPPDWDVR
jgi:hypothetical protein